MKNPRIIIIGDVHGCMQELSLLLQKIEISENDRVIFLGDLVDKGPDPLEVLRFVRKSGFECILGNHEEKHIRIQGHKRAGRKINNKITEDMISVIEQMNDEDYSWLCSLPRIIRPTPKWILVHGGLFSGIPPESQKDTCIRLRYVSGPGKMHAVQMDDKGNFIDPKDMPYWAEIWQGPENVIYGHNVHSLDSPTRFDHGQYHCFGIDTGCVYGGNLTAMIIENIQGQECWYYVQQKKVG